MEAIEHEITKISDTETFTLDPPMVLADIIGRPILVGIVRRRISDGGRHEELSVRGLLARPDGSPKPSSTFDDRFLSDEGKSILAHLLPLPGSLPLS